jgi:hypothetical protein
MIMDNRKPQHYYDDMFNENDSERQDGSEQISFFPSAYKPGEWDVICQRGRENYDHGRQI